MWQPRSLDDPCLNAALCAALCIVPAATAGANGTACSAEGFVETFDSGNEGGWTFFGPNETVEPAGGNPGPYVHVPFLDTFAPQPGTDPSTPSAFSGDFRACGVDSIGIDLNTFDVDFSAGGRPLALLLISDNDTPGDDTDDWAAYVIGPDNVPLPGEGWLAYDFDVPSAETSLPAGWNTLELGPSSPPAPDWNDLATGVARVRFFYGDPTKFYIFQGWDLGLDNPRIASSGLLFGDGFESGDVLAWSSCTGCT